MARQDFSYDEMEQDDQRTMRRDTYRVRRATASRKRTTKRQPQPGGIRQRRNKHWNW